MFALCEIMTFDEVGGASRISFEDFSELYTFLVRIDGEISNEQKERVLEWLKTES